MAKRDFIYDTRGGRIYIGVVAVLLLVLGAVLVVLGILLGARGADGFWWQIVLGISSIIFGICNMVVLKKRKPQAPERAVAARETAPVTGPEPDPESIPNPESMPNPEPVPGDPDEVVVLDPTRINEPDGAIRVFRKEGVLVYDGKSYPIDRIVEGYVANGNDNPYLPIAYHILLAMDDKKIVHILAGQDFEWAQEALKQLREAIAPQE